MEATEFVNLISNVGFPIACCIAMFIYMWKTTQTHKEEIEKLSQAVNNNTNIMTRIYEKLNGHG